MRAGRSFSSPPKARLVILEHGNPAFLKALDLEGTQYTQLTSGYDHFYFGLGVLITCVRSLLKRRQFTARDLGVVYLSACLRQIGARVVLTFIDNSILFYHLAAECPGVRFVAVQNGMRDQTGPDFEGLPFVAPATYFCFGDYDVSLQASSTPRIAQVVPVGSVLDSYHHAMCRPAARTDTYDLCLISQYRSEYSVDGVTIDHDHPYAEGLAALVGYLKSAVEECGLTICVAGATSDDPQEKAFYQAAFGRGVPFSFRGPFSSYELMDRSQVVVGVGSTCLFEAFSRGKKTLFCALSDRWQGQQFPPNGVWLLRGTDVTYAQFKERLLAVLAMDGADYAESSRPAARYYMHYDINRPAHEVVRAHLMGALNES